MRSYLLPAFGALALAACSESPTVTGPRASALAPTSTAKFDIDDDGGRGAVFTQTNATSGNAVVAFSRAPDGSLTYGGSFPTGGSGIGGTNDPLTSQYSLILDGEGSRLLFVVNAGSNSISTFRVNGAALQLVGTTSSGGTLPTSLAISHHTLYALNAGSNTVRGFDVDESGNLTPNTSASASLSAGTSGAAAIRASRDGSELVVTEKGSNTIDVFSIGTHGSLSAPVRSPSVGVAPFGFDFLNGGQIAVSEAGSAAASSYAIDTNGGLTIESPSVSTNGQAAPCWLIATTNGHFAFTANAGSGTISGYSIDAQGTMQLLVPSGISGSTGAGSAPLDLDLTRGNRFLYVLESGAGRIGAFAVGANGELSQLAGIGGLAPASGFQGLAAY